MGVERVRAEEERVTNPLQLRPDPSLDTKWLGGSCARITSEPRR